MAKHKMSPVITPGWKLLKMQQHSIVEMPSISCYCCTALRLHKEPPPHRRATLKWKWAVEGPLIGGLRQNRTVSQHPVSFRWKMRSNGSNEDASRPTVSPPTNKLRAALNINTVKRGGRKIVAVERRRFTVPNSSFFWAAVTRKALPLSDLTVISTVYLCGGFCGCHGYNSQPTRGKLRKFNHHKNPLKATLIHKAEAELNCRGVRSCEVVLRTRTHCRSVWSTAAPAGCAMAWRSSADATFRVRSSIWKHFTVGVVKTSSKDTGKDFCELLSSQANE